MHTENVSSGGVKVIMHDKLDINTPVKVEVVIGDKHIVSRGRVVWVLDVNVPDQEPSNLFDTGIEFTQLNPDDREFLSRLIEKLLEEGL